MTSTTRHAANVPCGPEIDLPHLHRLRRGLNYYLDLLAYLDRWSYDHVPAAESIDVAALVRQLETLVTEPNLADVIREARRYAEAVANGSARPPEVALRELLVHRGDVQAAANNTIAAAELTMAMAPATRRTQA